MQLHRDHDRLAAVGDVYVIGMGTPAHARAFKHETGLDFPLLVSPDKAAYEAMDLRRGSLADVFAPDSIRLGFKRWRSDALRRPEQDWHQLGGVFVIAPGGGVTWEHRASHSGDNPSHDELAAALQQAA